MLGELVVNEIKHIEHEKSCSCASCAVNVSIRAVSVFTAHAAKCKCPVCLECGSSLVAQATYLGELSHQQYEIEDEIEAMRKSPIVLPHAKDLIKQQLQGDGILRALAMALAGNVKHYGEICNAAHHAYECVESGTVATIQANINHAAEQIFNKVVELETGEPPRRNPNDVN